MKQALLALGAALCSCSATARASDGPLPPSFVALYAGGAFMREYSDNCGDYYYDCGPYYHSSDTYDGPEFGLDARLVTAAGLLFDVTAEHARVTDYGDAFKEQQVTAGLGYQGHIGWRATWYAEGFYQHYRLGENFAGCDYSCNGWYKANGGGVKGGIAWPFADRFFGTLDLRVSYLSGSGSDVDLVQAKVDGSVGYRVTDHFSVSFGASSQAIEQAHDHHGDYDYGYYGDRRDDTLSHVAVYVRGAVHF